MNFREMPVFRIGLLVIIAVMFFIGLNKIQSCGGPVNGTTVAPLSVATPTEKEKTLANNVIGVIKPTMVIPRRDQKVDTKVLISQDPKCNTCSAKFTQVTEVKTFIGFTNSPKFYFGYTESNITLGYAHEFFRWGKTALNLNATFPYAGTSITYDLTNNFDLMLGGNVKYIQYNSISEPSTYNFDIEKTKTIYPLIGAAFFF